MWVTLLHTSNNNDHHDAVLIHVYCCLFSREFSGGWRMRIALARALFTRLVNVTLQVLASLHAQKYLFLCIFQYLKRK